MRIPEETKRCRPPVNHILVGVMFKLAIMQARESPRRRMGNPLIRARTILRGRHNMNLAKRIAACKKETCEQAECTKVLDATAPGDQAGNDSKEMTSARESICTPNAD